MKPEISKLYQEVILLHSRNPHNYEKITDAQFVIEAYNPLCGDKFKLFLEMENGLIIRIHFHGYGCAISKASTSILTGKLEGLALAKAMEVCREFFEVIRPEPDSEENETTDPEFRAFLATREYPGRLKCASLSWDSIYEFLEGSYKNAFWV